MDYSSYRIIQCTAKYVLPLLQNKCRSFELIENKCLSFELGLVQTATLLMDRREYNVFHSASCAIYFVMSQDLAFCFLFNFRLFVILRKHAQNLCLACSSRNWSSTLEITCSWHDFELTLKCAMWFDKLWWMEWSNNHQHMGGILLKYLCAIHEMLQPYKETHE